MQHFIPPRIPAAQPTHRNSAIHFLFTEGLLSVTGEKPDRIATITELGMLELDCAGVTE